VVSWRQSLTQLPARAVLTCVKLCSRKNMEGYAMGANRSLPRWLAADRLKPAVITGVVLFVTSYSSDVVLEWWGKGMTATILNNVAIGILGSLAMLFYLSASYERNNFDRAKERMRLVNEVNRQVREALGVIGQSAMLEDRSERLLRLDEATDRIDGMLTELVPIAGGLSNNRGGAAAGGTKRHEVGRARSER
jgi:hypothetical protein